MAASPSGKGSWIVATDGAIFNHGDAPFEGSAGAPHLAGPTSGWPGLSGRGRRVGSGGTGAAA